MSLVLVSPPQAEPIDLADAKAQLRVTGTDEDGLINSYIATARRIAELRTRRALVTQTWDLVLDALPVGREPIHVPRPPLQSVSSITYVDTDGVTQTLGASLYTADTASEPGRIEPAFGETWPATRAQHNAATIRFIAGHATPFTAATSDVCTGKGRTFTDTDRVQLTNSGGNSAALPATLAELLDHFVRDQSDDTFKLALTSGGAAIDITDTGTGTHFVGAVPEPILNAMRLLIGAWHENREEAVAGQSFRELPADLAVRSLLDSERVLRFT